MSTPICQELIKRINEINTLSALNKESKDNLLAYCQTKQITYPKETKKDLVNAIKTANKINYHDSIKKKNQKQSTRTDQIIRESTKFNPIIDLESNMNIDQPQAKKLYDQEISKSIDRLKEEISRKIKIEIDDDTKANMMKEMIECFHCHKQNYGKTSILKWLNDEYCLDCHYLLFNEEIQKRGQEFDQWKIKNNLEMCLMKCGSKGRNFDHTNMFDKCYGLEKDCNSLGKMLRTGIEMEHIYREILEKTIPLCISCHNVITKLETQYLLTRLKTKITKDNNKENLSDQEREDLMKKEIKNFETLCKKFYKIAEKIIKNI